MTGVSKCGVSLLPFLLGILSAGAQDRNPAQNDTRPAVYIVEFKIADSPRKLQLHGLNEFATSLAELKLSSFDELRIVRVPVVPVCRMEKTEGSTNGAPAIQLQVEGERPYYIVRGSLEPRASEVERSPSSTENDSFGEVVLTFELSKVTNCVPQPLVRRSIPFRQSNALENLSLMSDMLAVRVKDATTDYVKVDVKVVEVAGPSTEDINIATAVDDAIVQELGQSSNFTPQDLRRGKPQSAGEYSLQTKVQLTRKRALGSAHPDLLSATVDLSINSQGNGLWKSTITRSFSDKGPKSVADQLAIFYGDVADAVLEGLNKSHSVQTVNIHQDIAHVSQDELEQKISELLCKKAESNCHPDPQAALPLLIELNRRPGQGVKTLELLGQTQYQAGQYLEAAQSFDKASEMEGGQSPEMTIALLNESGDGWYRFQNYDKALERYQASLDESVKAKNSLSHDLQIQPDIRLKLARCKRFKGDREGAFLTLLDSMPIVDDATQFNAELRDLVGSMRLDELAWAETRIGTNQNRGLDLNVLAVLYEQLANNYLHVQVDLAKADKEISKAEAIPPNSLSLPDRGIILRLRGEWYLGNGKWAEAEPLFKKALALDESRANQYRIALFYYEWASQPNQDPETANKHSQLAADSAAPLLRQSYLTPSDETLRYMDTIYRYSNHRLGRKNDEESKKLYKKVLESHPKDISSLKGLMSVCTDFLQDFGCALEAAVVLDQVEVINDPGDLLDIAEIYVLNGRYDEALRKIEPVAANLNVEPTYHVVAHFYQTWAFLGKGDAKLTRESAKLWNTDVTALRHQNDASFRWVFGGAPKALENEKQLSSSNKATLHDMILAMENPAAPLPNFPQ